MEIADVFTCLPFLNISVGALRTAGYLSAKICPEARQSTKTNLFM